MPARHEIDDDSKLIITTCSGDLRGPGCVDALLEYQRNIKSKPAYSAYNEILDFTQTTSVQFSTDVIKELAHIASSQDAGATATKLAIIVNKPLAYGLCRMYQTYRSLIPGSSKEVRVFKNFEDGLAWIISGEDPT